MTLESKLTAKVEAKGAKEAAEAIRSVGTAQEDVAGKAKGATEEVKGQTKEQAKLNAAEGDFISLLTNINPQMGLFGDLVLKGAKVLNTAGDSTLNLTRLMGSLRNTLKANIGALKFFAASGAVIAGIAAIAGAMRSIEQEAARAKKSFDALDEAADEATRKRRSAVQNLAQETAKKRGGILSIDELKAIQQEAEKAQKVAPGVSEELIRQAAASFGPGATAKEIAQGAVAAESFGFQFTDVEPPGRQRKRLERTVRQIPGIDERIGQLKEINSPKVSARAALEETSVMGGGTANLEAFIASLPGDIAQGLDPKAIAQVVRELQGGAGPAIRERGDLTSSLTSIKSAIAQRLPFLQDDPTGGQVDFSGQAIEKIIRAGEFVETQLLKAVRQESANRGPNVTIHNNSRFTTPGPNRNRQTGEADANDREQGG